ncbi:hypothetical protein OGAPHI_007132 [Ogataea philodendri]|uniref:Uncharacterized protein n=1 Tax=Ogataea philodendri TaxID=1378263 RepID=A0A9P8T0F5_9ASCO|nr:uncharacterized protein OGAPHI_007132 [Ogataea philodendri]KAH3660546.1 hypothetical protein OGAPHI_007132 [Ogataea philodendri]
MLPNCWKYSVNSSSVTSGATPPTKILPVLSCSSLGMALLGSINLPSKTCVFFKTSSTLLELANVKNPNPLDRPVALSFIIVKSTTSPN